MPDWKTEIGRRIAGLKLAPTREAEIVEELAEHLADRYQELLAGGATEEEAHQAALAELSDGELLTHDLRRVERSVSQEPVVFGASASNVITTLLHDLRYGVRTLRKDPGFAFVAVLTLAMGIGAATAIFSVVYATLFEPLPYPKPDQLMMVWSHVPGGRNVVSPGDYLEWKNRSTSFQLMEAFAGAGAFNLATKDRPEQVQGGASTPGFYTMVGTPMFLGRDFLPEEGQPGNDHVVILTHRLWSQRFGADYQIIGQQIRMNGEPYTVVGVLAPGIADRGGSGLSVPLAFKPDQINHEYHSILVMGRLKDGVSQAQAQAEMSGIAGQLAQEFPKSNTNWGASVEPLHLNFLPDTTRRNLWLLQGAVGFLLLIACVNVANLLLARGTTRRREVALRAALGASRARLFSQLLTESFVLSIAGGVLGVLLARLLIDVIVAIMPLGMLPLEAEIRISIPVLLFTIAATMLAGLIFGCAPAWQGTRLDLNEVLKQGGRTGGGAGKRGIRRALVIAEFALALTMLASGGLALKSFWNLTRVDLGVQTDHVLTFDLPVPEGRFPQAERISPYYHQLLERIESVPGVRKAAVTTGLPLRGTGEGMSFSIVGAPPVDPSVLPGAGFQMVTPGYYDAFGIRIVKGRSFDEHDTANSMRVAMVNENFADRYFAGMDPLNQRIAVEQLIPGGKIGAPVEWQIVGVFHNVRNDGVRDDYPEIDVPFWQSPWPRASVVVRTEGDPNSVTQNIAAAVNSVDNDLPLAGVKTMEQLVTESIAVDRFGMVLFGSFAITALLLAAIGVYGVMAFGVAQRTHEFGLRMALGAGRGRVLRLVLMEGLTLAAIGSVIGLGGAFLVGRSMETTLYGVKALDIGAFGAVAGVLFVTALLASYLPARRAMKVDPMVALRYE
jgi:putative ABC transport system permease protein